LIACVKSEKVACQGAFLLSGGLRFDSICAFYGAFMHRETEANDSDEIDHFWGWGVERLPCDGADDVRQEMFGEERLEAWARVQEDDLTVFNCD
jgi:hypothetical protein